MATQRNHVENQSYKLITGFLNTTNDAQPGAQASPSGTIIQPYTGMEGGVLFLDATAAASLSATGQNTLFEGQYQYVQFLATATAAPAVGKPVFWSDRVNYIVTTDVTAATVSKVAGVVIFANTKGNWGFIQISGRATCLFKGTTTKTTPADGDLVVIDQTPALDFDVLADATTITSPILKTVVGVAYGAPVGGASSLVDLRFLGRNVV